MRRLTLCALILAAASSWPGTTAALTFNFTSTGNSQADTAFAAAGARWSALFNDNMVVNVTSGYTALSPGVLGQAGSNTLGASYSTIKTALAGDALSANDLTAVANLPSGSSLSFLTNNRLTGVVYLDNDGSANNTTLDVNRANLKALGLLAGNDAGEDVQITFNSNFAFDFDPSNGITAGQYDFVGIATHELGHALGFVSGVDIVDYFSAPNGPGKNVDLNDTDAGIGTLDPYRVFSVLDLYRYTSNSILQGGDVLDLAYGDTPFFSIDGATNLARFATGAYNGDSRQASHWKDNLAIGIMDPTAGAGELLSISTFDKTALDVIGYNLAPVPEPSTLVLAALGAAALALAHGRRRRAGC